MLVVGGQVSGEAGGGERDRGASMVDFILSRMIEAVTNVPYSYGMRDMWNWFPVEPPQAGKRTPYLECF